MDSINSSNGSSVTTTPETSDLYNDYSGLGTATCLPLPQHFVALYSTS